MEREIKCWVDREFSSIGITLASPNADLQLYYHIVLDDKAVVSPGKITCRIGFVRELKRIVI